MKVRVQNIIIAVSAAIMVLTVIFPPWVNRRTGLRIGHAFVTTPPSRIAELDITTLAVQVFIVAIIAGVLVYFFKNKTVSLPLSRCFSAEADEEKGSRTEKVRKLVIISFWILGILVGGFLARMLLPMVVREKPKPQGDIFDTIQRPQSREETKPSWVDEIGEDLRKDPPAKEEARPMSEDERRQEAIFKAAMEEYARKEQRKRLLEEIDPSVPPETFVRRGNWYLSMNRTEEARDDFYRALAVSEFAGRNVPPVLFSNVDNDAINHLKARNYGTVLLVD